MIILDTDTFSLLGVGHPRITARLAKAVHEVTIIIGGK